MGRKKQVKDNQPLQDKIDILFSWVKPTNDTEKQALDCVKYELRKILEDNERMQLRDRERTTTIHAQVREELKSLFKREQKDYEFKLSQYEEKVREMRQDNSNAQAMIEKWRDKAKEYRKIIHILKDNFYTYNEDKQTLIFDFKNCDCVENWDAEDEEWEKTSEWDIIRGYFKNNDK